MSDVILVYPVREGKKRRREREREKKEAVPISFCVCFSKVTRAAENAGLIWRPGGKTNMLDPRS